jgi:hypothetical protein
MRTKATAEEMAATNLDRLPDERGGGNVLALAANAT